MVFVISDLHGYSLKKLKLLLEKANFSNDDTLYILGDVIDRNGDGGVETLLWIMQQINVKMLLGNHEQMLRDCWFVFNFLDKSQMEFLNPLLYSRYDNYVRNGGGVTISSLEILRDENSQKFDDVRKFLRSLPLYYEIEVGGKEYLLTHAGLANFDESRPISDYSERELVWYRPYIGDVFYNDKCVVFGHTPTCYLDEDIVGEIIVKETWIDIDAGASMGNEPILLCLNNMTQYKN